VVSAERFQRILNLGQLGKNRSASDRYRISERREERYCPAQPYFPGQFALSRRLLECYAPTSDGAVLFCTVCRNSFC
jgi:hypothetical protein